MSVDASYYYLRRSWSQE